VRRHERCGIGEVALERLHVALQVASPDEAAVNQLVADVVDEVPEDRSSGMAEGVNVDDGVDVDVRRARVPE
jgi:hypothetical protein